ncbi:hypothetical protein BOX15_Mlig033758g4, partial [Macrostomum lignano]
LAGSMSKEIVRAVSRQLDHYLRVQRLEDSFDLSGAGQPIVNHPKLRELTLINTLSRHDRPLKHEFSSSQMRVKLRHMHPREDQEGGRAGSSGRRRPTKLERSYTRQLESYLSPPRPRPRSAAASFAAGGHGGGSGGLGCPPVPLRSAPPIPCSRRERRQLVRRSGKILGYLASPHRDKNGGGASAGADRAEDARPLNEMIEERVQREVRRGRRSRRHRRASSADGHDSSLPPSQKLGSPEPPQEARASKREAKRSPRSEPQVVYPLRTYSVTSCQGTQTSSEYDQSAGPAPGPRCHAYILYVTTGDRIGAGTNAAVSAVLYGELGSSGLRPIPLANSLTHKRPFRRGRTDKFVLENLPDLGGLRRLRVGHASDALNHWYLHSATVVCPSGNRWFFPCRQWLSDKSPDGLSTRTLNVELVGSGVGGGNSGEADVEAPSPADLLPAPGDDDRRSNGGNHDNEDDSNDAEDGDKFSSDSDIDDGDGLAQVSFRHPNPGGSIPTSSDSSDNEDNNERRRRRRRQRGQASSEATPTAATKSSASSGRRPPASMESSSSVASTATKSSKSSVAQPAAVKHSRWRGGVGGGGFVGSDGDSDNSGDSDTLEESSASSTGRISPDASHLLLDGR